MIIFLLFFNSFFFCASLGFSSFYSMILAYSISRKRPGDLKVRVGSAFNNDGGQLINPSKYIIHEEYDSITIVNDIALIILEEEITIESASPVPLPAQNDTVEDFARAINSGWGRLFVRMFHLSLESQILKVCSQFSTQYITAKSGEFLFTRKIVVRFTILRNRAPKWRISHLGNAYLFKKTSIKFIS